MTLTFVGNLVRASWRQRTAGSALLGATLLVTALAFASPARIARDDQTEPGPEPELVQIGSFEFEGPIVLEPGQLDVRFDSSASGPISFSANATDLAGFPGSLYLAETPFGPAALLRGADLSEPAYTLLIPSYQVVAPLQYSAQGLHYVGPLGSGEVSVGGSYALQNPGGIKVGTGRAPDGSRGIFIWVPCAATFKQFFTKKVTWKGTMPNPSGGAPLPTGGTHGGPARSSGNAGQPHNTDGGTAYVDSTRPGNGDYRGAGQGPDGSTTMTDAPNVRAAKKKSEEIEEDNPGATVTEFTTVWHFTTYVYCGGKVIAKVEWSHTETCREPFSDTDTPNGDFGGPTSGPPTQGSPWNDPGPRITPTDHLDPHHDGALQGFENGNYSGAPAPSGW